MFLEISISFPTINFLTVLTGNSCCVPPWIHGPCPVLSFILHCAELCFSPATSDVSNIKTTSTSTSERCTPRVPWKGMVAATRGSLCSLALLTQRVYRAWILDMSYRMWYFRTDVNWVYPDIMSLTSRQTFAFIFLLIFLLKWAACGVQHLWGTHRKQNTHYLVTLGFLLHLLPPFVSGRVPPPRYPFTLVHQVSAGLGVSFPTEARQGRPLLHMYQGPQTTYGMLFGW